MAKLNGKWLSNLASPDSGTMVGLLTAAGVYLIYNNALPSVADVRTANPDDQDADTARKHATLASVGLVAVVFLVARDINSYIISGAALVGIDLMYKHANQVNPASGKVDMSTSASSIAPGLQSLPDYGEDAA